MGTDLHTGATLKFHADPRFAAAAAGVARYLAEAAGIEADAVTKLQAATLATCLSEAMALAQDAAQLSVNVCRFPDRIEVVVTREGAPLPSGAALPGVDKVERGTESGEAVTRLTKFIPQN